MVQSPGMRYCRWKQKLENKEEMKYTLDKNQYAKYGNILGGFFYSVQSQAFYFFLHGFTNRKEVNMDGGVILDAWNDLSYFEGILFTIWLFILYYGKCWIDERFKK